MNPFKEAPVDLDKFYMNWKQIYPKSYDKTKVDPYTKARIILMNGAETEQIFFFRQKRDCEVVLVPSTSRRPSDFSSLNRWCV